MTRDLLKTLIERAKNLILKPAETWDAIALEEADVPTLYKTWIAPLAAITPIASLIGFTIVGMSAAGFTYRMPFANALSYGVVWFALTLVAVYALAYIIDALAPHFGAEKNFKQAFKLSAYFPVAGWLAGVFALLPPLSILSIVGLYSLYLLWVGLPKLMAPPADKAGGYALSAIGAAVVLYVVVGLIAGTMLAGGAAGRFSSEAGGSRDVRTAATVAPGKPAAAGSPEEALGAALGAMLGGAAADGPVVRADALERLAPNRLVGLARRSANVEEAPPPFRGVQLSAEYGQPGEDRLTLTIVNSPMLPSMLPMLGLAALGEEETDGGYMRVREEDGDYFIEEWDRSSETGHFGRTLADTFMVSVEGHGVSERDLRRAVSEFGERQLTQLPTTEE